MCLRKMLSRSLLLLVAFSPCFFQISPICFSFCHLCFEFREKQLNLVAYVVWHYGSSKILFLKKLYKVAKSKIKWRCFRTCWENATSNNRALMLRQRIMLENYPTLWGNLTWYPALWGSSLYHFGHFGNFGHLWNY